MISERDLMTNSGVEIYRPDAGGTDPLCPLKMIIKKRANYGVVELGRLNLCCYKLS